MGIIYVTEEMSNLIKKICDDEQSISVCIYRDGEWKPIKTAKNSRGEYVMVYKEVEK